MSPGGWTGGIPQRSCEAALSGQEPARQSQETAALQAVTVDLLPFNSTVSSPQASGERLCWFLTVGLISVTRKYIFAFHENLQKLVFMGLLHFGPVTKFKEKDQVCCYF